MGIRSRREFLRLSLHASGATAAAALLPASIRKALAIPAARVTGTIQDVEHVVILMQENRSFDHYFGTLRGVRGFGDRHPVPLESGKPVWHESDGERVVQPYHLDTKRPPAPGACPVRRTPSATPRPPGTRASSDSGRNSRRRYSMGHYRRADLPFQFALAEAFTLCDAYHCSLTTGTDPNRIVFWSGSNFDPEHRERGENCTDEDSEPDNLRCWVRGTLPEPGYPTQAPRSSGRRSRMCSRAPASAGASIRIPTTTGPERMHGGLAFESFRDRQPGSPLYEKGMRHWSLEQLARGCRCGPAAAGVLGPAGADLVRASRRPQAPLQGAEFTARVLDALTGNPEVWSRTALFLTFDENDGHVRSCAAAGAAVSQHRRHDRRRFHPRSRRGVLLRSRAQIPASGRHGERHRAPLGTGSARADAGHFALEQGRLGRLAGV